MHTSIRFPLSLVTLAAVAGLPTGLLASTEPDPPNRTKEREWRDAQGQPFATDFRSCHTLTGRDIVDASDKQIATVTDLIIERGSGHVRFLVLKTGATLGMGGKTVAAPFNQFRWDARSERFMFNAGKDQLKSFPEFSEEQWKSVNSEYVSPTGERRNLTPTDQPSPGTGSNGVPPVKHGESRDSIERMGQHQADADASQDSLRDWMNRRSNDWSPDWDSTQWDAGKAQRIEGEIKSVDRVYSSPNGEHVVVVIAGQDGATRKVALGPTWYISAGEAQLNRGDKISVDVVPVPIATAATINGHELRLRGPDGASAWSGASFQYGGQAYTAPYYKHVLLSKLRGTRVDCRGVECGKVNDLIIEARSGSVAFISIDPNQNFLGIADTKRIVPWSVATVSADGTVRIDASKEMVLSSPETPSEPSKLNTTGFSDSVYSAYQVSKPNYNRWYEPWSGAKPSRE